MPMPGDMETSVRYADMAAFREGERRMNEHGWTTRGYAFGAPRQALWRRLLRRHRMVEPVDVRYWRRGGPSPSGA